MLRVLLTCIQLQLRYCPSLAKKPGNRDTKAKKPTGPGVDPFENPPRELLVAEVPAQNPSHIVVLNKFPIIENHFILATKQNKQQTYRLEAEDLARTYQCLSDWECSSTNARCQSRLFAFFNSGAHSGASQPHRHLQFLPVEDMKAGQTGSDWSLLVDGVMTGNDTSMGKFDFVDPSNISMLNTIFKGISTVFKSHASLPFVNFGLHLPPNPSSNLLQQVYSDLYEAAAAKVHDYVKSHPGKLELHPTEEGNLPISYNLAMTTSAMVICPRRSEGQMIKRQDGTDLDFVALNGTVLAGTMMVKNEELFEILKHDATKLNALLTSIGIPLAFDAISSQI